MTSLYGNVGGSQKAISSAFANIDGSQKQIFPLYYWKKYNVTYGYIHNSAFHEDADYSLHYEIVPYGSTTEDWYLIEGSGVTVDYNISTRLVRILYSSYNLVTADHFYGGMQLYNGTYYGFTSNLSNAINGYCTLVVEPSETEICVISVTSEQFGDENNNQYFEWRVDALGAYTLHWADKDEDNPIIGSYVEGVSSTNRNAYPDNGVSGNYWYVFVG